MIMYLPQKILASKDLTFTSEHSVYHNLNEEIGVFSGQSLYFDFGIAAQNKTTGEYIKLDDHYVQVRAFQK